MIDPVSARPVATYYDNIHIYATGTGNPGVVSESDKALFEEKLSKLSVNDNITTDTDVFVQQGDRWVLPAHSVPEGVKTVGERILDSMDSFQEHWSSSLDAIKRLTEKEELHPSEMLNIQFQIGYSSMMLATISQEVGSVSQKIDGLLKAG